MVEFPDLDAEAMGVRLELSLTRRRAAAVMRAVSAHEVKRGECFSSIAFAYGFFWETLWNHPDNADLKRRRDDPFSLAPGDVVHIPDLRIKAETRPTGQSHAFRRKGVPAKVRVQLLDDAGDPRPGVPYRLSVDGQECDGDLQTDGDGWVEHWISPAATEGLLQVGEPDAKGEYSESYALQLGHARPHDTPDGAADRLRALGFLDTDDDDTEAAIEDFQVAHGIEPTGELDDKTTAALQEAFGG